MMYDGKISILMTTYNGAAYLQEQLNSFSTQRYDNFELIVIDDGSQDGTPDILSDYARLDQRVRLFLNHENMGQRFRLMQSFASSTGACLCVSDQDDIWHPSKISILVEILGSASIAFGRSQLIDAAGRDLGLTLLQEMKREPGPHDRLRALFQPFMSAHAALIRREVFTARALQTLTCPFDYLLSLDGLYSQGVVYDDAAIVFHRIHGGNQQNQLRLGLEKWSPWMAKRALRVGRYRRYLFLAVCDYLANSFVVSHTVRNAFGSTYKACYRQWMSWLRPTFEDRRTLRNQVHADLIGFALNPSDATAFVALFDQLLFLPPHPRALVRTFREAASGRDTI